MEFLAKELADATRNYSRSSVVGKGGYGTVYKGTLRYSTVAIKVLSQVHFTSYSNLIYYYVCKQ